jgi:hypothetical protein
MPTTRQFTLLLVFLLGAVLAGAEPDRADPRGLDLFRRDVRPVLEKKCLRCHGGKTVEAGLDLCDRAHLLKGGQSGPAVVPGKARASLLYQLVTHEKEPHMPHQAGKLPDAAVAALAAWIDAGAPYDAPLVTDRTQVVKWTDKRIAPEARHHWAFQPLRAPIPPVVRDAAWCRNPIDRFILARLEAEGLTPSPEADPRTLIRRVTFDLIGLPPTPEETALFLREVGAKPQAAYAALVERLLASPHYGERWARHWLDVVRFGETDGFERNTTRPNAWPYRDWLIRALNADLPYDEFARLQLAGDERGATLEVPRSAFRAPRPMTPCGPRASWWPGCITRCWATTRCGPSPDRTNWKTSSAPSGKPSWA